MQIISRLGFPQKCHRVKLLVTLWGWMNNHYKDANGSMTRNNVHYLWVPYDQDKKSGMSIINASLYEQQCGSCNNVPHIKLRNASPCVQETRTINRFSSSKRNDFNYICYPRNYGNVNIYLHDLTLPWIRDLKGSLNDCFITVILIWWECWLHHYKSPLGAMHVIRYR